MGIGILMSFPGRFCNQKMLDWLLMF
jgi:hypothetical protein